LRERPSMEDALHFKRNSNTFKLTAELQSELHDSCMKLS